MKNKTLKSFQKKINDLIKSENLKGLDILFYLIFIILPLFLYIQTSFVPFMIFFIAGLLFHKYALWILLQIFYPKRARYILLLNSAKQNLSKDPYLSLKKLFQAYNHKKSKDLFDLLRELSAYLDAQADLKMLEINEFYNNNPPEHFLEVFDRLKKIQQNRIEIQRKAQIVKNEYDKSVERLKDVPNSLKDEAQKISENYRRLYVLQLTKLDFFKKLEEDLLNILDEMFYRDKLRLENEKYQYLSQNIVSDTIKQSYSADDFKKFVEEKRIFLNLLDQYTNNLKAIDNEEEINEIMKKFNFNLD